MTVPAVNGRLLYCEVADLLAADDGDLSTVALIRELQLNVGGSIQTLQQITNVGRVDLRLGQDNAGEIYLLSKGDGAVRQFVTLNSEPPGPAEWTLIDNFETHTAGDNIDTVVGPGATWDGGSTQHTAQVDPADAANLAMRVNGAPGNGVLRGNFSDPTTNIAPGATGTLFYRIRTPVAATGTTDHVLGLTDNASITNFNFKSGLRNIVPGANTMELRDGVDPGYEFVATLADNTWYSVWMVSTNTNPGTFEVYVQSETDSNFATQTLVVGAQADAFDYRINGDTSIINVYFRNANNDGGVAGNDLYFDDVYINSSAEDLTDPTASSVLLGDVDTDGDVDFFDIQPFIDVLLAPGGFQAEADCDENGVVNFFDIQPFIDILLAP